MICKTIFKNITFKQFYILLLKHYEILKSNDYSRAVTKRVKTNIQFGKLNSCLNKSEVFVFSG